jgi:Tol biopolymer transport system component
VARLDDRLRRDLARAARPADPAGVYEELIRRRERRRIVRSIQAGALALVVIAGTLAGVYGLSQVFRGDEGTLPAVSPWPITPRENGRIAITTGDALKTLDPAGSDVVAIPLPGPGLAWHVAWSPDGERLALVMFEDQQRTLYVMGADGSNPSRIASAENVSDPSWWPDQKRIAYVAGSGGRSTIHVVNSDGSDDRVLYGIEAPGTRSIFSAKVSPDGTQILFDQGTDEGFDIFVMAADGSAVRQLTHSGQDYNPSWSPDGTRIAFTRQEGPMESDIFTMAADGTDFRRLTDDGKGRTNLDPIWAPDGTMIAFVAGRTGGPGPVVVMDADGTNPAELGSADVLGVSWQSLSPSASPSPTPQASSDIGLGFPVCNVTSIEGQFRGAQTGWTAYVATKRGDVGPCPNASEADNVVAVDVTGDGQADAAYGPIVCDVACSAFAAPDVDGDGTDELLVQDVAFSIAGLRLFEVTGGDGPNAGRAILSPVTVAPPGDPAAGYDTGKELRLWLGGDAFRLDALRCESGPDGRVLVATSAESKPHDSPDAVWYAHETTLMLRDDGRLDVVGTRDFQEPATSESPSFATRGGLCAASLPSFYGGD